MNKEYFRLTIVFSVVLLTSVANAFQNPPPPCGRYIVEVCDKNLDEEIEVNLRLAFPNIACNDEFLDASDYFPITYYFTQNDAFNAINPINNPESFKTTIVEQFIFTRTDPIDENENSVKYNEGELFIVLPAAPNIPAPFVSCNDNDDGFEVFDLRLKKEEILPGYIDSSYFVEFFESYQDAVNLTNKIEENYRNILPYNQTIYVSTYNYLGYNLETSCISVVELELIVSERCEDLEVQIFNPSAPPRPGFNFYNILQIVNEGSQTIGSGTVQFDYDSKLIFQSIQSTDENFEIVQNTSGFNIEFTNLEVGNSIKANVNFTCPATLPLGTKVTNTATYLTITQDVNSANNKSELVQTVVGSYDPNDILESHGPEIIFDDFSISDEYLYYTIRFQNLGTAAATFIKIENFIDAQLDRSTFQMLSSSHDYVVTKTEDNLEWFFEDIQLPAAETDEDGSQGYVYFKIKPIAGYGIGDIIPNAADIYFDFNEAVVTNTFETNFVETLSMEGFTFNAFNLSPNPANVFLNITINNYNFGNITIELMDIQGKQILRVPFSETTNDVQETTKTIDVSGLQSGMYFIKVSSGQFKSVKKFIKE